MLLHKIYFKRSVRIYFNNIITKFKPKISISLHSGDYSLLLIEIPKEHEDESKLFDYIKLPDADINSMNRVYKQPGKIKKQDEKNIVKVGRWT